VENWKYEPPTWQSSTHDIFVSSWAVNDNIDDFAHTDVNDKKPWFVVDLGSWIHVHNIVMTTRKTCCRTYIYYLSDCELFFFNQRRITMIVYLFI
jgi:hypothetical protein